MKESLIVFVKKPVAGKVKTRLAKTLGDNEALKVYIRLLEKVKELISDLQVEICVYYSEASGPELEWGKAVKSYIQVEGDLGVRMKTAIQQTLTYSEKVVLMGSDCPGISQEIIQKAFEALDHSEIVLGPTEDGGYYLIGMKKCYQSVFENITWSTTDVLKQTVEAAEMNKISLAMLPTLRDIDEEEDYRYYLNLGLI